MDELHTVKYSTTTFGETISLIQRATSLTDRWRYYLFTGNISYSVWMHFTWNAQICFYIAWFVYCCPMYYQFYCQLSTKVGCLRRLFYSLYIPFIARFDFANFVWMAKVFFPNSFNTTGCMRSSWSFWVDLCNILDYRCMDNDAGTPERSVSIVFILVT